MLEAYCVSLASLATEMIDGLRSPGVTCRAMVSANPTTSPPRLNEDRLEPVSLASTVEPSFLGYTAASWLELIEQEGPVFEARFAGEAAYVLCGHEADVAAWRSPDDWLYGPPSSGGNFFLSQLGETHVTQLDGEAHRRVRKLILPAFGVAAVTRDIEVIDQIITEGLRRWHRETVDLHPGLSRLIATALNRTQLKEQPDAADIDQLVTFEEAFIPAVSLSEADRQRWYSLTDYRAAKAHAFAFFERIVRERVAGVSKDDSLDLILSKAQPDNLAPLHQDELVSVVYLLSVAGVGNIANILCAALWAIDRHPDVKARLRQELSSFEAAVIRRGMGAYPWLRAVISEVERCYLPAPVIPKMTRTDVTFQGYQLPGGSHVLQLHGLGHFESARYPDPFSFKPQRWLEDDAERPNAFGGGTHLCLGMGVTRLYVPLILGHMLRAYDWTAPEPPRFVRQREDKDFSPMTTRFLSRVTRI